MRRIFPVVAGLVLITFAAHWRVLQNDFVNYDDNDYVTANKIVQAGVTKEGLAWAFGNLHATKTYWHPLTWVSHMVDCQWFGLKPAGHHAMSLVFHGLNVVLLFVVLERMTGARWRSALVAAIWAVHPLQVDTVAWVTERKNELSAMFWLLAMAAYVRYAAKPGLGRYWLVPFCMALGLMCKPVLVTLPFALLLLDFWPLRRWNPRSSEAPAEDSSPALVPASPGRLLLEKVPLLVLSIASSLITLSAHSALGIQESVFGLTTSLKIQNALVSYVRYLGNTIWPQDLTVLHLHPGTWPMGTVIFAAAALLVLTGVVFWSARRRPYVAVGWLWFLGVLVPTIGLRQPGIQAMADRFMYVPLLGLIIIVVWSIGECLDGPRPKAMAAIVLSSAALAALCAATNRQTGYWRDSIALWEHALAVDPNNYLAHRNISVALLEKKQLERAEHHAAEAVRLHPGYVEHHLNLGVILMRENKPDQARGHFERALRTRPDAPATIKRIARIVAGNGDVDSSIGMLSAYVALLPTDVETRAQLAAMLTARGRGAEAATHFRELLRQYPDFPAIQNAFAWILATNPDATVRNGAEAVRLAERACELTGRRQSTFLGTLAAAYAEAGRFDDAVRTAQEAVAVAIAAKEDAVAHRNREWLELYRAGKPCREAAPR